MLSFKNRLKKRNDFSAVLEKGRTAYSDIVVMRFLENNLNETRFGFIVSKKISKKSVTRNKIKRRLREQVRIRILKIKKGLDIVIIAKRKIIEKDSKEIGNILEDIFLKNELINK